MDMRFSTDMTHFVTASADKTAKLMDARTFEILKVYKAGSPLNAIDMSPTHDYVNSLPTALSCYALPDRRGRRTRSRGCRS